MSGLYPRYQSAVARDVAVRKFVQIADGIYMLPQHVRPEYAQEKVIKLWGKIVNETSLMLRIRYDKFG